MTARLRAASVAGMVAVITASCSESPILPSDPLPPQPAPVVRDRLTIVSGWDRTPVFGAIVKMGIQQATTNADGQVFESSEIGARLDIDAPGFLPRKTTVPANLDVTLWPVTNEQEADAIRSMVYDPADRGGATRPATPDDFLVSISYDGADSFTAAPIWRREAANFGMLIGRGYQVVGNFQYETNEVAVQFKPGFRNCTLVSTMGFCRPSSPYHEVLVDPQRATDPAVVRRVVASWFLPGPNPLPGLMNIQSPDDTLSLLERQAIHMLLQRARPNRYPDSDR